MVPANEFKLVMVRFALPVPPGAVMTTGFPGDVLGDEIENVAADVTSIVTGDETADDK